MSTKVCVDSVKPGWADAVTLGVLENMIAALYGLGYDIDTPVTFLYDHRHVWLETVHDVDDDFDIEVVPEPRVWEAPDSPPPGVIASDDRGRQWKWEDGRRYVCIDGVWDDGVEMGACSWMPYHVAALTEVLP